MLVKQLRHLRYLPTRDDGFVDLSEVFYGRLSVSKGGARNEPEEIKSEGERSLKAGTRPRLSSRQ